MKFKTRKTRKPDLRKLSSIRLPGDYAWKVLGWLTDDLRHCFTAGDYERIHRITRDRDLGEYLSLADEWGLQSIPSTECSLASVRARYQVSALLKKFQFPGERKARTEAAKKKFLDAEESCRQYNQCGYMDLTWAEEEWMVNVFTYARSFLQKLLGNSLPGKSIMTDWSRHGPGSSLDTRGGRTSTYFKYSEWPYSCTSRALRYARFLIETDQRWLGALQDDYRERFGIPKHYVINEEEFWARVIQVVPGNRITFVPKNALIDRSIAIEPTLNLYLQLGVDGYIRKRLKRWGVDLDDQVKNQRLACQGSMTDSDYSFVTLDLAAASDSISLKVCESLLPLDWYNYLCDLRSPQGDLGGREILYEKISSMGNGFTFALESSIFTSIIYGVLKEFKGTVSPEDFAVYGDDLIVRKQYVAKVIEALANCGFAVNTDKSFFQGPCRESCGADWFRGKPVRPVFFNNVPTLVTELFTDINRLDRLLSLRFGIEESKVCAQMEKWVPEAFSSFEGPLSDESFDSYRHRRIPKGVYNYCLWKYKRLIIQPIPQRAQNFLFRKLMHDLRGAQVKSQKWDKKLAGQTGRFTATSRNAWVVRATYSVSDIWTSMYNEV